VTAAPVDSTDADGNVHAACLQLHVAVYKEPETPTRDVWLLLLQHGAHVDFANAKGETVSDVLPFSVQRLQESQSELPGGDGTRSPQASAFLRRDCTNCSRRQTVLIIHSSYCVRIILSVTISFFWQMNKPRKTYEHLQNRHTIMVSFSAYCRLSE